MWLKRILWLLSLALLALCHIFTGRNVFMAVLLAAAILPWVSLILLLIAARRVDASLLLPENAAKNELIHAEITMRGSVLLSAMRVQISGRAANLLTGDVQLFKGECLSGAADVSLMSPHCGKITVDAESAAIKDPLGLFVRKKALNAHGSLLVLPNTFEVQIELETPDAPDIESDDYSAIRSGDDPSELFGIRSYREGDSLRSIHWKLSEKYDRTVVKEMSQQVAHAILLLLDNCPGGVSDYDRAERACEALISVSQALADSFVSHQIAWFNRETGLMELATIASLDDLAGEQGRLLSARILQDGEGIVARALEDDALLASTRHVLLFAPDRPAHAEALADEVTLLLPEADPADAISCLPERLNRLLI